MAITIREYRRQNDLSLADLGHRVGMSAETVRRYEAGLRFPEPDALDRLLSEIDGAVVIRGLVIERDDTGKAA